jgi:hypothetical protein
MWWFHQVVALDKREGLTIMIGIIGDFIPKGPPVAKNSTNAESE